jgi:hypothetical protein
MSDKQARPWDLINPNISHVSKEVQDSRLSLCITCPEFFNFTKQCKKCGCVMTQKVKLPHASCPIGKWSSVDEQ